MLCFYDSVRPSLGIINNYSLIAVRICVSLLKSTMNTNLLEKLPKTEKEWLHFFKKVEALVIDINKKYENSQVKEWLKKVKGGEVSYSRNGKPLSSKPNDKLSYQAVYQNNGVRIEEDFRGEDEGDFRDRGSYRDVIINNVVIKYRLTFIDFINFTEAVDGIDIKISIQKCFGQIFEFRIELENVIYLGVYNGQSYTVSKLIPSDPTCALSKPEETFLKCYTKECKMSEPLVWALEFAGKNVGEHAQENIKRLTRLGYRSIEEVEKDDK